MTLYNRVRMLGGELIQDRRASAYGLAEGFQLKQEPLTPEEECDPHCQLADLSDFLPSEYYAPDSVVYH